MSNHTQPDPSSTRPSVGTRIKRVSLPLYLYRSRNLTYILERYRGVFQTVHGVGENIRGRTLGAIDDVTKSGSPESKSRYTSLADRGRMEVETGMARVYGYPDPNAANVLHNEPGRLPPSNTANTETFRSGHTTGADPGTGYNPGTGYTRTGENDYDYRGRDGGVSSGAGGYGADDGYGQPGVQNFRNQQPAFDGNTGMGSLSPNRGPQSAGPEGGSSSTSQAGALTPPQQRVKGDAPPELPPRPQGQATNNDQRAQMYQ